ncbi:hypothetical protein Y032_0405g872 [Ancylostoma ceylanicum]|nr:hypothetical protein Y032_0405g872 [Ancylostoma ceylanicum]
MGYEVVSGSEPMEWDVLWTHEYSLMNDLYMGAIRRAKPHQIVNHVAGSGYYTSKVSLATSRASKDTLRAFQLPKQKELLLAFAKDNPHMLWVQKDNTHSFDEVIHVFARKFASANWCKPRHAKRVERPFWNISSTFPESAHRGGSECVTSSETNMRNIRVRKLEEMNLNKENSFVQQFVDKPLLIDNRKFDIGVYTVVTSVHPLRVYTYTGDVLLSANLLSKLFYHGLATKNSGVAIAVAPPLKDHVSSVTRVSERIISIRIATEIGFWSVVSAYAPQCGCNEIEKAGFYDELDNVIRNVPESDYLTIGGDFNGHVGQDRTGFERIHGGRGFGSRNQDGERVIEFAEAHDLAITSTFFIKRESQKITYSSGGRQSEIDHVLVRRNALKTVKNVKSIPGEEIAGQHRPVVADICMLLPKQAKSNVESRIRWWKLTSQTRKMLCERITTAGLPLTLCGSMQLVPS